MTRCGPEGWCVCGEDRAPRQRPCRRGRRAGRTWERAGGAPRGALTPGEGGVSAEKGWPLIPLPGHGAACSKFKACIKVFCGQV